SLGRLRRRCRGRQLGLDRQRVHRPRLQLRRLGWAVLRGRLGRQPARYVWRHHSWPRRTNRACELVDANQQADSVTTSSKYQEEGPAASRPFFMRLPCAPLRILVLLACVALIIVAGAQATVRRGSLDGVVTRGPIPPVCVAEQPCDAPAKNVTLLFSRADQVIG